MAEHCPEARRESRYAPKVPTSGRSVSSRQHPLVARFREAARRPGEAVLLDGVHLVAEAIAAGLTVDVTAFDRDALARPEIARLADMRGIGEVVIVTESVLDAMSPTRTPMGVVALARRPHHDPGGVMSGDPPLIVVAVDVQDPGNLGALLRAAEAGGATAVVATMGSADAFGWKALRGSMGSAFRLPIVRVRDAFEALATVRGASGLRVAATVPIDGVLMSHADLTGPLAILVGAEGSGLPDDVVAAADLRVSIPMAPRVESLNVAVATALLVYEAGRQRAIESTKAV
jgi:TrmH family RNA methyltransferase